MTRDTTKENAKNFPVLDELHDADDLRLKEGPVLACIDMGTNSFHMIVCRASHEHNHFEVITRMREAVPFFRTSLTEHVIDPESEKHAIRILRRMRDHAHEKGARTITAVATSAVRESRNGAELLRKIRQELNIDAKRISGREEARLIYLGVLWRLPKLTGQFAIVDIGGGSTEIIVADRARTIFSESYKLGAARLTAQYFPKDKVTPEALAALHDEVRGMLRPCAVQIAACGGFNQLIGTSGTISALVKINRAMHSKDSSSDKEPVHGTKLTINNLEKIVDYIEKAKLAGIKIKGVSNDRGATILAGAIVLLETMRSLGANSLEYCDAALREGVVVDRFVRGGWLESGLTQHRNPRANSVHELLTKYGSSSEHTSQVARLALAIFDQSHGKMHQYDESVRGILWTAAMLHDIGTFIARKGHHKHSFYLIKNGGLLGHSEEEIDLIACIARYHRGNEPKESHSEFAALTLEERKLVADMSAILRIAEALDRSHRQIVRSIKLTFDNDKKNKGPQHLLINVSTTKNADTAPESWAFEEKKPVFEKQFALTAELQFID
ncbi:MAG: Ppx/GppA family phosphatase [Candidatus Obscuribacterales bacterium]|nr:Ppx/GppA family phosphatase [Candidatus Obscuribacterales bacterium]